MAQGRILSRPVGDFDTVPFCDFCEFQFCLKAENVFGKVLVKVGSYKIESRRQWQ